MRLALGHARREQKRIVVSFDEETFDQVNEYARLERVSFAEAIRTLVTWGLEATDER